jgi:DNA gyrase inhibitor GyrI
MDINIEMISSYKIAYIRKIGPYGSENIQVMEQLKNWATEKDLFNERSIILGIAQDNPKLIEPKDCRYDACLVVSDEFKVDNKYINFGKTIGGKYCVFKISHTVDAMQKA